jgi:PilZ domain
MTQARRDSPRIPYDEAICLARTDGKGRLYGRGVDLSGSGISLVSTESCPIGTEIKCDILLPHGPRSVTGKIVRVTAAPGGFELAVAFGEIKPAVAAVIANLVAERTKQALPAKLRIDGVDKPLRCEAHVDEQMVRLTATLPFLRLDGGVDVLLGEQGGIAAAGTIRKISVDPSTADGIPRLALDVALDDEKRARTKRYGTPRIEAPETAPPPPDCPPPVFRRPAGIPCPRWWSRRGSPVTSGRSKLGRRAGGCTAPPRSRGARTWPSGRCARPR